MPNTLRITHLTESLTTLNNKISLIESIPDREKTTTDHNTLKQLWSQRVLYKSELEKLEAIERIQYNTFFGKK